MVTRLRPLDLKLIFEDRPYRLGETINLRVELKVRGDVLVREGRVDLVCEGRWTETYTVMVPVSGPIGRAERGEIGQLAPRIPKHITKERRETNAHSAIVFIKDKRLYSGAQDRYNARLKIRPEPPSHASEATLKWTLVAAVDVARARDIKTRRPIKVVLPIDSPQRKWTTCMTRGNTDR